MVAADILDLGIIDGSTPAIEAYMIKHPATRKPPAGGPVAAPESDALATEQLGSLQAQLDLLKAQVRQAQQLNSLGAAAATIAHEVSNLLTPIQAYAQAALDADDAALQRKALTVTLKNVRMLVAMSDRVLEISAAKPAKRESVSVRGAIEDAVASLCRDLGKDGIRLSINLQEPVTVWADRLQLQQILFNLFLNAREAMAPSHGGVLKVSATSQQGRVVIEVTNTSGAIPPELLPHIFDPFQTSKSAGRGERTRCTGLGLALCRDLIEENNGTISVTSDRETGTTFIITFPPSARPEQTH